LLVNSLKSFYKLKLSMKTIWINRNFTKWEAITEGYSDVSKTSLYRTYELWNHANDILIKHSTNEYLSDAITNLNRAIALRTKILNKNYCFKKSPFQTKKNVYKQLEDFEIVRPKLLNEIRIFRNNIEHNDKKPPSYKKCQDFLEICWYFLKATDLYVIYVKDSVVFEPPGRKYWISLEINFERGWTNSIRGWLKSTEFSTSEKKDFLKVDVKKIETRQQFSNRLSRKARKSLQDPNDNRGENPEDVYFQGKLISNPNDYELVMKQFFRAI
jgi:hypothetical protein